jgi:hypothetical protein
MTGWLFLLSNFHGPRSMSNCTHVPSRETFNRPSPAVLLMTGPLSMMSMQKGYRLRLLVAIQSGWPALRFHEISDSVAQPSLSLLRCVIGQPRPRSFGLTTSARTLRLCSAPLLRVNRLCERFPLLWVRFICLFRHTRRDKGFVYSVS